jgi:hypothetical protein
MQHEDEGIKAVPYGPRLDPNTPFSCSEPSLSSPPLPNCYQSMHMPVLAVLNYPHLLGHERSAGLLFLCATLCHSLSAVKGMWVVLVAWYNS